MNETSVQPIYGVRATESSVPAKVLARDRGDSVLSRERAVSEVETPVKPAKVESIPAIEMSNISIHFNVDDETNRLIVIVTERESGRVIRTIPTSELEKMQAGDLLRLNA